MNYASQILTAYAISLSISVGLMFFFLPMELLWPARALSVRNRTPTLLYLFFGWGIFGAPLIPPFILLLGDLTKPYLPHPFVNFGSFSRLWLTLLTADFLYYWWHRAQHRFPFLWSFHKLHHLEANLSAASTQFMHPLCAISALFIFQLVGAEAVGFFFIVPFLAEFSHANWRLRLGWFSRFVVCPQVHRIHHSMTPEHLDKNFAGTFPVFDLLFGTYHQPRWDEWPATGIIAERQPTSPLAALLLPIASWRKQYAFAGRSRS